MEANCTSLLSIGSDDRNTTFLTVCDEVTKLWQIPLIIATVTMVTCLALSCGVIFILHKILDPFKLMEMSSSCFPACYLESIWPEDQKRLKGPILHFTLNPSKQTFNESNQKLLSKTGYDIFHWSIKHDYYLIMQTIFGLGENVSPDLVKKVILEGSTRMIKLILREVQKDSDLGNVDKAVEILTEIKGRYSDDFSILST